MKKYPSQHPDIVRARNREYREKNKEKLRLYDAARYAQRYAERKLKPVDPAERARSNERSRIWRLENQERVKEAARQWRAIHPKAGVPISQADRERINAQWRAAYADRAEYYRAKSREKRARKAGAIGSHTEAEWQGLVRYFGYACVYCGEKKPLTRDHVVPLSRAELEPTNDIANILPACRSCNSRKKNKTDWEYRLWRFKTGPVCHSQSA